MEEAICHVNDYHDGNKYKEGLTRMKCKRTPRRPPTRDAKINSYQKKYIYNKYFIMLQSKYKIRYRARRRTKNR
jgi:hypothetical protein